MLASDRVPHEHHAPPGLGPAQGPGHYIYQSAGIPGQQMPQRRSTSPPTAPSATSNGYPPTTSATLPSAATGATAMSRSLPRREVTFDVPQKEPLLNIADTRIDVSSYEYELPGQRLPQRRNSDSDQQRIRPPRPIRSNTTPPVRSVRWSENLICPSPIPKRIGWFNRRGDQLWTNSGQYKEPPPGEDYPPDLDDYPEPEEGWQNEQGVRIDLKHRLVPKAPLRSALKRTNYRPPILPEGFSVSPELLS